MGPQQLPMSTQWTTMLIVLSLLSAAGSSPAFQDAVNQEDAAVVTELPEAEAIEAETDSDIIFDFENEVQLAATGSDSSSGSGEDCENYTVNEACCTCGGGTTGDDMLLERPRHYVVEAKRDSDLLLSVEAEA